eukprot:snap_masked-scaffold_48-processed-gene-0.5-mRNA-1 protein AED:1.00 eAED:1.00 QI:0/0/0/0/1/1/3/0/78
MFLILMRFDISLSEEKFIFNISNISWEKKCYSRGNETLIEERHAVKFPSQNLFKKVSSETYYYHFFIPVLLIVHFMEY